MKVKVVVKVTVERFCSKELSTYVTKYPVGSAIAELNDELLARYILNRLRNADKDNTKGYVQMVVTREVEILSRG